MIKKDAATLAVILTGVMGLVYLYFVFVYTTPTKRPPQELSVEANMFTFQMILDIYAEDWQAYPDDLNQLKQAAQQTEPRGAYWKGFNNPCTGQEGLGLSYQIYSPGVPLAPCLVYYLPLDGQRYLLYGSDAKGEWIKDRQNKTLVLSNA